MNDASLSATSPPSLPDASARAEALDPTRSFIVQAPAGSGKTELLTQRYLRLLTTVAQPEQILAITFTRKAAGEMRQRILQALTAARCTPRPDLPHAALTWDLAQHALQRDQAAGWHVETHPARLRIHTIDALNGSLARRLPLLSGMGAAMDIAQDTEPLYEDVVWRLLAQLGDGSRIASDCETVLRHVANRVPDFQRLLCDLLQRRDHWLPLVLAQRDDAHLRTRMEATLQAVIVQHLQRLMRRLPAHLHAELAELAAFAGTQLLKENPDHDWAGQLANMTALPKPIVTDLPQWQALARWLLKKNEAQFYQRMDKRHGVPADAASKPYKARIGQLLVDLDALAGLATDFAQVNELPAPHYTDSQWQLLAALLHLLPEAAVELCAQFQARGQIDFVEQSLRALRALGSADQPTDVALALDARLQHILMDEFQDTSQSQSHLLQLLTAGWSAGDGRTVFCVGDPMQSIYRFRQAEVGLFLAVQAQGLPNVAVTPLKLQTNFRSTQPIVQWVNAQFPHIMPREDAAQVGAVSYSPSVPRPGAPNDGHVVIHAAIDRSPPQEAQAIATLVADSLRAHATQRVAILVSGRSHVGPIAQALKQHGIAFRAVDIEPLAQRSLIQDLMALTRALVHVADRTAWLACLRAPWCGLTLPELHALCAQDAQRTVIELIAQALNSQCLPSPAQQRLMRFHAVMSHALAQRATLSLREWVERTWLSLQGPACLHGASELDDAQRFFARLSQIEVAGDLEDVNRLESQMSELYAHADERGDARVEIMTIHKSKGLEFEVVILPSLHRAGGRDTQPLLRWAQLPDADDALVLATRAATGADSDAIYDWLGHAEKQRANHERQRLLYVAATRARRELHLFGSVGLNTDGAPKTPNANSLLSLLWPQVQTEFVAAANAPAPVESDSMSNAAMSLQRLPLDWAAPALPVTLTGVSRDTFINTDTAIEFAWVGEVARHVGTVVHAELERLVKCPVARLHDWQADQRREAVLIQLAELGVPEQLRARALERVIQALQQTLSDERGRWILGMTEPLTEAVSELALSGLIHQHVIHGVIDRSFVDAQGTRWIIDFKTSSHEGGGREEFLQREVERYRLQLQRYATLMAAWQPAAVIRTALYFPLLGEWREVT